MKVGHLIRTERVRQEMKQIVLAKGICTPSYLSKIERNLIAPSEEITALLFERLQIDVKKIQKTDQKAEIAFEKLLRESYKNVITKRDETFTRQKLEELEKKSSFFENQSLYYTYLLITLRFRLTSVGNLEDRYNEIEAINEFSDDFDNTHQYLFKVNKALYYYFIKNRKMAIEYFEEALSISEELSLDSWEKAELNFMLGVVYTADGRIFHGIEYNRRALAYFREHFQMNRVVECYVLIGITQKKSEQFQEAFESYFRAKQITDEFNLTSEKGIIYHNIGSLYGIMGNSVEAVNHLKQSIKYKKNDKKSQLISIFGLILEYSKLNDKKLVFHWCEQGNAVLDSLKDDGLISYYHHFNFFKSLHSEKGLSESIALEAIEHFKALPDYQYIYKYSIALAEWYYNNRKYKLSSILFNEANRYGYIYRKNTKWEDL